MGAKFLSHKIKNKMVKSPMAKYKKNSVFLVNSFKSLVFSKNLLESFRYFAIGFKWLTNLKNTLPQLKIYNLTPIQSFNLTGKHPCNDGGLQEDNVTCYVCIRTFISPVYIVYIYMFLFGRRRRRLIVIVIVIIIVSSKIRLPLHEISAKICIFTIVGFVITTTTSVP